MKVAATKLCSIFRNAWLATAVAAASLAMSQAAHADLVKYSYVSIADGARKDVVATQGLANPSSGITFMVSGGIDRKLRIAVTPSGSQSPAFSKESGKVLGASDVITYQGKNYYAEEFASPKLPDGSYQVTTDILASTGEVVKTEALPLVIDTTGPAPGTFAPLPYTWGGPVLSGDVWKLGIASGDALTYSSFVLKDFSDTSGISKVVARVYRETGVLHKEYNVLFSEADKKASIQYRTGFFPNSDLDEVFGVEFLVTDKAGNTTTTNRQKVMFDDIGNAPTEPFGVYDPSATTTLAPGLTGFVPYVAGMAVKTNPIRLAWKIPKSNWSTYRLGGLSFTNTLGENKVVGEDAGNIYLVASLPYRAEQLNYVRFINFGSSAGNGTITYDLVLADEAPKTPVIEKVEYYFSDKGWMIPNRVITPSELPVEITQVRYTVEKRPFAQVTSHYGTCTIPANETQCVISTSKILAKGTTGYMADIFGLRSSDGALVATRTTAQVVWNDLYYPVLGYTYNESSKILTLKIQQQKQGDYNNRLGHKSAWLEGKGGTALNVTKKLTSSVGEYFEYEFDLKTLPEGVHDLVAGADEKLGAVSKLPLFKFDSDRTSPVVTVSKNGSDSIDTLDKISFTVADNKDPAPKILSVNLKGGPANESIALSYRKIDATTYGLEYPILFPSLSSGEVYTLTVTAQDSQLNTGVGSTTFMYKPATTGIVDAVEGVIKIPAVPAQFDRKDGSFLISSEQLKLADGTPVSGVYSISATLRADAVTPLTIDGISVKPGATVTLKQLDFTQTAGKISIPVVPQQHGAVGNNGVIISTSAPNSPVVYASINTWMPQVSLEVGNDSPVQAISDIQVKVSSLAGNSCRITTSDAVARAADPILEPVCLLEWTAKPKGLEEQSYGDGSLPMTQLVGRALNVGKQPVGYSLSIYTAKGSKILLSSGERMLDVQSATAAATFRQSLEGRSVVRAIETASLTMQQVSGESCSITADEAAARAAGAAQGALVCLIQFTRVPDQLRVSSRTPLELTGVFARAGEFPVEWTASIFDSAGTQVVLSQGQSIVKVVHPTVTTRLSFTLNESSQTSVTPIDDIEEAWEAKTYSVISGPTKGTVEVLSSGFKYTPAIGYTGTDRFAYRVTDASGMTADGEAQITVAKYNYPPTMTSVSIHTRESASSMPIIPAVEDLNTWDSHAFEVVQEAEHGKIVVTENGLVYTPDPGFYGSDSFRFIAIDQEGYSVEGQGSVVVDQYNLAPIAITPPELQVYERRGGSGALHVTDPNLGDSHTLEVVQQPAHGFVTLKGKVLSYVTTGDANTFVVIRATDQDGLHLDQAVQLNFIPTPKGRNIIRIHAPISFIESN
ncbi:DUF4165 domain-containing protein [Pseudomonas sp. S1(2024)]|uniref:DUF4165 domain-containing protein n=1 Tax=Pseudomonas sp. S1(2024) TaxID=3390191 RepID=UPI00397856A4